jgi:N-acetyltransferase
MLVEPVVLEGAHVRLEPLSGEHVPAMCEVGLDPELWRWTPYEIRTPAEMRAYVEVALADQIRGAALPFVTIARATGRVIGSTRFGAIERQHRRVEIGWTWLGRTWQRTVANTEAKLLMLTHAFETWRCIRVELKTDALNEKSRAAIERIGAVYEGIFRHHMITAAGRIRNTAYYSVIDTEWPVVKAGLERRLAGG